MSDTFINKAQIPRAQDPGGRAPRTCSLVRAGTG